MAYCVFEDPTALVAYIAVEKYSDMVHVSHHEEVMIDHIFLAVRINHNANYG